MKHNTLLQLWHRILHDICFYITGALKCRTVTRARHKYYYKSNVLLPFHRRNGSSWSGRAREVISSASWVEVDDGPWWRQSECISCRITQGQGRYRSCQVCYLRSSLSPPPPSTSFWVKLLSRLLCGLRHNYVNWSRVTFPFPGFSPLALQIEFKASDLCFELL